MAMNTTVVNDYITLFDENNTITTTPYPGRPDWWYWRVALYAVGGACIECAGIVCNIIAIIVLANFRNSSSAPFLLICLAFFDSVYLLSLLLLEGLPLMEKGELMNNSYREFILPIYSVLYPLPFLAQTCVAYLVALITIERFTVVAWPLSAHRLCSIKSARIAVSAILLFAVVYHVPTYMAFKMHNVWRNDTRDYKKIFGRNKFGMSRFYTDYYTKWINICVNFAFPFAILLTFNVLMIIFLHKSKAEFAIKRTFRREEHRLTLMVFCMTIVFFICELLAALSQIVLASFTTYNQVPLAGNRFSAVADTFLLINSAINFAIYCVTGRKFRQTFVQLFCKYKNKTNVHTTFSITTRLKMRQEYSRTRPPMPRRSTTDSSLSSLSNGTRCSKYTLSSDSIHRKLTVKSNNEE